MIKKLKNLNAFEWFALTLFFISAACCLNAIASGMIVYSQIQLIQRVEQLEAAQ